ncbi:MAG: elongation factor P, partial [Lachnospiraceae bacterium]|nr:elongation factor P [Lachnospiraceae bacterium]
YFMDPETYEQDPIAYELVKDAVKFIKENDEVTVKYFQGKPFSVEAPTFVDLIVTEAEPAAKGNTATNVTKIVTVETGATVQVPSFIEEGEKIQIDTRTGEYLGRAK